jgi:hypothetical protein
LQIKTSMSWFKKIFGQRDGERNLSPEQFFESQYIKYLLEKYRRFTIVLNPQRSDKPIDTRKSKLGGTADFSCFKSYPRCTVCDTPLNFVLQLYKKDFPDFYYPNDSNLFQLFRCPNEDCPEAFSDKHDHKMFCFYFNDNESKAKELIKPVDNRNYLEPEGPDCYLKPKAEEDFPNYDDFEGEEFSAIEEKFGNDFSELFMETYAAINHTKLGGYPSFTQYPFHPTCSCGKRKDFFFQLSSEDLEEGVEYPPPPNKWSAHGIMIGDAGNLYFYVCKSCGPQTIETYWDCY